MARGVVENDAAPPTAKEATFAFLRAAGMTTVFGNPGSTELRFLRDWPSDFRYVTALHEQSAVAMADGYAQVSRNAAFVNLHSAGGVGNAMGSIFTAYKNQTPLVVTAGQQTRAMLPAQPFLYAEDAASLPRPYVKWSCEPAAPGNVASAIAHAYYIAMQRPLGPTFVSIPEDDWDAPSDRVEFRKVYADFEGNAAGLGAVAAALAGSASPALVVGPGVDRVDAASLAVALAERFDAAVWVSPLSGRCSFPERHPLFCGFLPPVRAAISRLLAGYDVVVVLGAPVFTYHVHTAGTLVEAGAALFALLDDPASAAAAATGTTVIAGLRAGLERILAETSETTRGPRAAPPQRPSPARIGQSGSISGAFALQSIADTLPQRTIVVEEAPSHRSVLHEYLPIAHPGGFFAAASGSLGWAMPAAVGIALSEPGRAVLALAGDGSALYSIQALWTAARFRLPVAFVVLNNRAYAAMNEFGRYLRFEGAPSFDLLGCDFVKLAEGFGVPAHRVERAEELLSALGTAFSSASPSLIEIVVADPEGSIY